MPLIQIPSALRKLTGGASEVTAAGATVGAALADLERRHPGIAARIFDERGAVRPFIRIFVDAEDIGGSGGLDTPVGERGEIAIVPAIAGGHA